MGLLIFDSKHGKESKMSTQEHGQKREEFKKNYSENGGIYDPDKYYDYHQECKAIEKQYKGYDAHQRQLKQHAFNKHLRGF